MIEVEEDIKYFLNIVEEEINSFITAAGTSVEAIIAARKIWGDGNLLKMVKVLLKLIMKKCVAPSLQLDSLAMWGPAAAVALQAEFFAAKQQLKERAEELRERAEKRKRAEERNLRRAYNGRDDQDDSFWSPEDHKKFLATNSPVSVQSSLVDGPLDQEVAEKGDLSKGPGSAHRQTVSICSIRVYLIELLLLQLSTLQLGIGVEPDLIILQIFPFRTTTRRRQVSHQSKINFNNETA